MKRLQFLSDIHLEVKNVIPKINVKGEYLALLGDIGNPFLNNYSEFITNLSYKFEAIFIISGNHEYWNDYNIPETNHKITNIVDKFSNVYFLNNNHHYIDNYLILGTTLWSNILNRYYQNKGDHMNIKYLDKNITVDDINTLHSQSVEWLKSSFIMNKDKQNKNIIVLSHHLPSYELIVPMYKTVRYNSIHDRFASNLDHMIQSPITAWLCGHSHCSFDGYINDVYCGINAVGYKNKIIDKTITLKH